MTTPASPWAQEHRLAGLRRFAFAITVLNLLGHTVLGFEQSWAQPLVALATTYGLELVLEMVGAKAGRRRPRYAGGAKGLFDFLLSAHITGLAVSMLIYANERLWPICFAAAVAIGSKAVFRVAHGETSRHFFNPSNLGISVTLILFPWIGLAPPYHFTENVVGAWDWLLPAVIVASGTFINARFTKRLPLIAGWLLGFVLQAVVRSVLQGTPVAAAWMPVTGLAFLLYTFYMITDPATTPSDPRAQVIFGASVAAAYGVLVAVHVVFGLFFALAWVCLLRGIGIWVRALLGMRSRAAASEAVRAVAE